MRRRGRRPLACRGLHKSYGDHVALRGVDLSVEPGRSSASWDRTAPGRRRRCASRSASCAPTRNGARARCDPWTERAHRRRIGYLPSSPRFYERMRGGRAARAPRSARRRARGLRDEFCERLALTARISRDRCTPTRAACARSSGSSRRSSTTPSCVCSTSRARASIRSSRRRSSRSCATGGGAGRTILFSSHVLSEVDALCDRVALIRAGRIVDTRTLAELRAGRPRIVRVRSAVALTLPDCELLESGDGWHRFAARGE